MRRSNSHARADTATAFMPPRVTLASLRAAAACCRACDLWKRGTQTVFGEGAADAKVVLVGEQPGHEEDLSGHPSSVLRAPDDETRRAEMARLTAALKQVARGL